MTPFCAGLETDAGWTMAGDSAITLCAVKSPAEAAMKDAASLAPSTTCSKSAVIGLPVPQAMRESTL